MQADAAAGGDEDIAVVVGGIIPAPDAAELEAMGIKRVYTPADYELMDIMESIVEILESR